MARHRRLPQIVAGDATYLDAKDLKTIETYWGIKLLPATISVISPMGHHGPVVQVTREKIQIWSTMEGYYPLFGQ